MIELENSDNIIDRQKYAAGLKMVIGRLEDNITNLERPVALIKFSEGIEEYIPPDVCAEVNKVMEADRIYLLNQEKTLVKKLKIKLSNYDVYNQQTPYRCSTCGEQSCVCQEAGLGENS